MDSDTIRVLLADDHTVVRAAIRSLLESTDDISVVAEASNGYDAVTRARETNPDVIVMDLAMEGLDGIGATREIVARDAKARVLILTMFAEERHLMEALDAGASGYLVKTAAAQELIEAIRAIAHGSVHLHPRAALILARGLKKPKGESRERIRLATLTGRERDVLRMVAEGHSAPGIGARLAISSKTVDTYKQRIKEKLGIDGRPEFVSFALRLGILSSKTALAERGPVDANDASHGASARAL